MKKDIKAAEFLAKGAVSLNSPGKITWESFKQKAIQLFGGLLMEKDSENMWTISLGRVSFWLAFLPALYIWLSGQGLLNDGMSVKDISPNHLTMLLTLAGYNFGKKIADTVKNVWGKNNGPG